MIAALSLFSSSPLAEGAEPTTSAATSDPLEATDASGAPTLRASSALDELIAKLVVVPGEARGAQGTPAAAAKKAPAQKENPLAADADEDDDDDELDPSALVPDAAARAAPPQAPKLDAVDLAWIAIHAQSTATPASPPEAGRPTTPSTAELAPRTVREAALTEALARGSVAGRPALAPPRPPMESAPAELAPPDPRAGDPLEALVDEPFAPPPSSGPVPSTRARAAASPQEPALEPAPDPAPGAAGVRLPEATKEPTKGAAPDAASLAVAGRVPITPEVQAPKAPRSAAGVPAKDATAAPKVGRPPSPGRYTEIREPRAPANDAFAPPDEPFSPQITASAARFAIEDLGVDGRERERSAKDDGDPSVAIEGAGTTTTPRATHAHGASGGHGGSTGERHASDPIRANEEVRDARELASAKAALDRGEGARGSVELGDAGRVDVHALRNHTHVEVRVAAERDAVAHALASQAPALSAELGNAGIPARVVVADPSSGGGNTREHRAPSEREQGGDAERGAPRPSPSLRARSRFVL